MVKITVYQNDKKEFIGFDSCDHAGYAQEGDDIVCAAVSALVINCINSIEQLTDVEYVLDVDEAKASISLRLNSVVSEASELLMKSLVLGLQYIEEDYNEYLDLIIEEV